ncbi:uncharacterized protein PFL1_01331 [Pseudozyma flocculosa PF-1]|uniref:Hypervirulence associated protein TUDOR domain-containing protein n=1 Tax=Pseudozyma flocculosa TaxID=84751 RepID=A0A5C3EW71_9BASI|nr:uncharacterized protein PFL1_01331 [Pseudozyma flocculosa PF-1]EPQ31142.1 hypothetical protein PFL1_01331 [Pseudozyma flocculosa PF-1]SPO36005.1 uncharacterized protein PSFLO_01476 [Pseudozyma flocculosa]
MPSSKGKPTDPKLREQVKEEVKNMEKGGGKGQWSAWKASEMSKRYEAKGGGYEDQGDNPNEASKGAPKPKKEAVEKGERKAPDAPVGEKKKPASKGSGEKRKDTDNEDTEKKADDKKDEADAKKDDKKANGKETAAQPKEKKQKKEAKEPAKGTRTQPSRGVKK